jgi:hypothetical protein
MRGRTRTILGTATSGLALAVALSATAVAPVAASDGDDLVERTDTTYRLLPQEGLVRVDSTVNLTNKRKSTTSRGRCTSGRGTCTTTTRFYFTTWHSFWVPPVAEAVTLGGPKVKPLPVAEAGGGLSYAVKYPKLWNKKGAKQSVTIDFDLPAGTVETADYPTRIEDGYAFFCWWGMIGDTGTTRAILPPGWEPMAPHDGVVVERGSNGVVLRSKTKKEPADFLDCLEAVDPERLDKTYVSGGDGKSLVVVEAWPGDEAWAADMTGVVARALPNLEAMLGAPMPYGELRVREVATQSRRFRHGDLWPTDGVLGMCEDADASTHLPARLARAWIDPEQITDPWLAQGLASWLATQALPGMACADAVDHPGPATPDLDDWIEVSSFDGIPLGDWQKTTACRLVEAGAEIIGDEGMIELTRELIDAPVAVGTSHWLAGISRDLPDGLDTLVAALDKAGVDH